jgi:hypothetical protein
VTRIVEMECKRCQWLVTIVARGAPGLSAVTRQNGTQ